MKVIPFGATGMVGHGVLRECLLDPAVTDVPSVGRGAFAHSSLGDVPSPSFQRLLLEKP